MGKWDDWYASLPASTKEYLKNQPVWKDEDLLGAAFAAFIVGLLIGLCF